jgi:hypothetical protein
MILAAAAHPRHLQYRVPVMWRERSRREVPHGVSDARVFGGLRMATILEFKIAPRPSAASVLAAYGAGQSAEIVFFPGVRYERQIEQPGTKPRKPKYTRDTSDLES